MKKLNNRGFSLLELLIAVLILSIITVPLLHTYVTASRTAAKSRQAGDATAAAQNIVEAIQANSVSSVLSSDSAAVAGLFGMGGSASAAADQVNLTGITSGSSAFDAKVTLNPLPYSGDGGINTKEITQYTAMDAAYVQETGNLDPDKVALDEFTTQSGYLLPDDKQRTIELTISSFASADAGKTGVQAALRFHYIFGYYETTTVNGVSATEYRTMDIDSGTYSLFPAGYTVQTGTPFSVYLLFNPYYDGTMGAYQDEITVSNTGNLPCSVFLVKQKTSATTAAKESIYRAQVLLRESHIADSVNFFTSVFSNIGQNLAGDGAIAGSQISYRKFYSSVYYVTGSFGSGQLVDRERENRLYQITVRLYPAGSTDLLTTVQATKLQ